MLQGEGFLLKDLKWNKYLPASLQPLLLQLKHSLIKGELFQDVIGLDLSANAIKILQLNSSTSPISVENFAISPLPPGAIIKDEIKDPSVIATTLKNLMKQSGIKTKAVALAIPRSAAIIKNLTIDARLNSAEIEDRAWLEAQRLFPDLVQDIYLDFSVVGPSPQDASQLDMILVACRKEQLQPYLEVVQQSGLVAQLVDVNCYALERALGQAIKADNSLETVALLNLNFGLSSLIVLHEGQLIYAHDHAYEGYRFLMQVRKFANAENQALLDPINQVCSIDDLAYSEILKENLSAHLRHAIHFFYSSRPNMNIQKIIIAGDCAVIPELATFIQRETHIEAAIANPFATMQTAPTVDAKRLATAAPMLLLSYGLALSEMESV